jgi:hypothetical protein
MFYYVKVIINLWIELQIDKTISALERFANSLD